MVISDAYGKKIKATTEKLYRALEKYEQLDLVDSSDDCACAIFLSAGLKELGNNVEDIATAFEANAAKVRLLLTAVASAENGLDKNGVKEDRKE